MTHNQSIKKIYIAILFFLSIEYVGFGQFSVYRVFILPLSIIGVIATLIVNNKTSKYYLKVVLLSFLLLWHSISLFLFDDNWQFPLLLLPFVYFTSYCIEFLQDDDIDYIKILAGYSLPPIISIITNTYNLHSTGRFAGWHTDPNFCSMFLLISLVSSLLLFNRDGLKKTKILLSINIIICLLLMVWAGSRGAILSFFVCFFILFYRSKYKFSLKLFTTILFATAFLLLNSYIQQLPDWVDPSESIVDSLLCRFKYDNLQDGAGRHETWLVVVERLGKVSVFEPLGRKNAMMGLGLEYTHNTYLDFLVEQGALIGSLFVIILLISMGKNFISYLKNKMSVRNQEMFIVALALMIQLFTLSAISQKLFWLMVLFMLFVPNYSRKNCNHRLTYTHQ